MSPDPLALPLTGLRPLLGLLTEQVPGSRWDLLHWRTPAHPSFLLGRIGHPHPALMVLDEERGAPPFLLEHGPGADPDGQLAFEFEYETRESHLDWIWPLGERGHAPWLYGRLPAAQAESLGRRRVWIATLLAEFGPFTREGSTARSQATSELEGILHHTDSPIADLLDQLRRVARSETPVFIQGESGVGKELFARAIHRLSPRASGGFVAQNGGALTDTLIESELFGHSRGSFTGAREERVGLFEVANGGTFFLDEVGDLSAMLQVRLLRVLQDRQIRRVGENRLRPIDFRLVTATHRDVEELVRAGGFRLDLWYRIQGVALRIPPLRERPMDIPVLAVAFLEEGAECAGLPMRELTEEAAQALCRYCWPGNVRELQNEIGRVLALYGDAPRLERWMLSDALFAEGDAALPASLSGLTLQEAQVDLERRMIRHVLGRYGGNRSRSARALGLSRQGLLKKLKRLGMERVALTGPGRSI